MKPVDYDSIAPAFDRRYRTNRFEGIRATLAAFLDLDVSRDVLELGCGTGQWLSLIENSATLAVRRGPSVELRSALTCHRDAT